ncbi:MAG TPA: aspartate kinase [Coriobacteriia bacterium]
MSDGDTSRRPLIVQKFGGTSVATPDSRAHVCARVRGRVEGGADVIVVVSAMGRAGEPYATDTLLGLLGAVAPDRREADLLSSCGEVISAVVLAHELRATGVAAYALTGRGAGVLTDGEFGDAAVLAIDPVPLTDALARGLVPVVTGFQGVSPAGETTTLGRGGSDTTACAIGAALGADAVEIHTDVDGVMSADPRTCDGVRVLDSLQYEELFQMARAGAKVMHAPAAEIAMTAGVPVRVLNTDGSSRGTLVASAETFVGVARRVATAVSRAEGVTRFVVTLPDAPERGAAVTAIFRRMADEGVSLDMFTPVDGRLAFSVESASADEAAALLGLLRLRSTRQDGLAKVTLVGAGMHGVPGVMARIAEALSAVGIEILQSADSHYTISVLVGDAQATTAVDALHKAFGLGVE